MNTNRFPPPPFWLSFVLAASLLLSSCTPIAAWTEVSGEGPEPPVGGPSLPSEFATRVASAPAGAEPGGPPAQQPGGTTTRTPTPTRTPAPTATPVPIEPLTLDDALSCLAAGDVLYALALQNTNVRDAAGEDACRVGRIPRGRLVRITGTQVEGEGLEADASQPDSGLLAAVQTNDSSATPAPALVPTATPRPTAAPTAEVELEATLPQIGYAEDVQPIFQRTCSVCHSAVAQNMGLMVTTFEGVMRGSINGKVVVPGDPSASKLWQMVESGRMPMVGKLTPAELETIHAWISAGAPEARAPLVAAATQTSDSAASNLATATTVPDAEPVEAPGDGPTASTFTRPRPTAVALDVAAVPAEGQRVWLEVRESDFDLVSDSCIAPAGAPLELVSSDLILPVACGEAPELAPLNTLRAQLGLPLAAGGAAPVAATAPAPPAPSTPVTATVEVSGAMASTATAPVAASAPSTIVVEQLPGFESLPGAAVGISAPALGLAAPSDGDGWLTPRGGFCVQSMLPGNTRGITALTFAPDGRLFVALDSNITGDIDPLILYDAFHPSRAVAILEPGSTSLNEIFGQSTRITGMDWQDGALYLSRSGEVGRIVDGGGYEPLAAGFAVNSQLFHANNGLVISGGWVYVSAGGVMDGWSDGPIVGIGEEAAQGLVSGGNPWAARIVRAPLETLLGTRSISAFDTAARGARNPYGIAADPAGNIWFTDNGATNLPDDYPAGDEVNFLAPSTIGGGDAGAPYFGFPLALTAVPDWYTGPALTLVNASAPTGIAWAMGTIFFAQYGRDPGLYRVGVDAAGKLVAERVLLGWPILGLATAPDGALWVGMGDGGLYRLTSGCG